MELSFFPSRNGQQTCSADGRLLHSSFNPENEAQRFVQSFSCGFTPSAIVLIGACLPFCVKPLRERFPDTLLIAVQHDAVFEPYAADWDRSFTVSDETSAFSFCNSLYDYLGEEKLVTAQFISWKAAETAWPSENKYTWEAIRSCMVKAQSVLSTRNWFNLRWFRNTVHNLSRIHTFAIPEKTNLPVIVTASGPSLTKVLPFLKANRSAFILIAASSSISTLLSNDIVPDFCISTDGGHYATRHLRAYQTDSRLKNVPLIISAESAVPSPLLSEVPFILLTYGDAIETVLAEYIHIPSVKGMRNGTVSGTAAAFAAGITTGKVYMCGLDLAPGKGFQHAEPNENDVPVFTGQSRIKTLESNQASSRYGSGSLSLYRDWFSSQNESFTSKVFRLLSDDEVLEKLGSMHDVRCGDLAFKGGRLSAAGTRKTFSMISAGSGNASSIRTYLSSVITYIHDNPSDEKCTLWYSSLTLKQYIESLRMNPEAREDELPRLASAATSVIKDVIGNV